MVEGERMKINKDANLITGSSDFVIDIVPKDWGLPGKCIITKYGLRLDIPDGLDVQKFDQIDVSFKVHPDRSVRERHREEHEASIARAQEEEREAERRAREYLNEVREREERKNTIELDGRVYKLVGDDYE
jgi:hypothetical protein|tara:strand:- start:37366 stop:37758 length:393 start_codon:yes stop_codon:yes gene_type:complete